MFRARATLLLFCLALTTTAIGFQAKSTSAPSPTPAVQDPIDLAIHYLKYGDLEKARANCEAAVTTRPSEADDCLQKVFEAQNESKLRDFEAKVTMGKREDAIAAALPLLQVDLTNKQTDGAAKQNGLTEEQTKRFREALDRLRQLTLADAKAKTLAHKEEAAIEAADVKFLSPTHDESAEADKIVWQTQREPRPPGFWAQTWDMLKGSWLPNIVGVLVVIFCMWVGLLGWRRFLTWRSWHNAKGHAKWDPLSFECVGGHKTKWTLLPLVDDKKLGATELVLDAMARLRVELENEEENKRPSWKPASLLLPPQATAHADTDLIVDFLSQQNCQLNAHMSETKALLDVITYNDIDFMGVLQEVPLKIGNYDVSIVARFLSSVGRWLKAGSPMITGTAELCKTAEADDTVKIRLNCSGRRQPATDSKDKINPIDADDSRRKESAPDSDGKTDSRGAHDSSQENDKHYLSVAASTIHEDGIDITALCAERAVFKLLYRLRYPNKSHADADAAAAVRQAMALLERAFKQNRADGERKALLEKALCNLGCARHTKTDSPRLLLFEGVALALLGSEKYDSAIACFRELEVAHFEHEDIAWLRIQARYNRAVLLARKGKCGLVKAVSVYDELLSQQGFPLPDSARWLSVRRLAALGKLTAIADYETGAWKYFNICEAEGWLKDGHELLEEVTKAKNEHEALQDKRTLTFIAREANRLLRKCSLRFAEAFLTEGVLENGRPIRKESRWGKTYPQPSDALKERLGFALKYCEGCENDADLLADRGYIALLLGQYDEAQRNACRAMLWDPDSERPYYLAAEACYCYGGGEKCEQAKDYVSEYWAKLAEGTTPSKPVTAAFMALCNDLKMSPPDSEAALAKAAGR